MNSVVLKQSTFEDNSPLPELATSLSGSIEFGRAPRLRLSTVPAATWPTLVRSGGLEIAIDGHFVVADRLFLGRTAQEGERVAEWVRADLPGFLQRIQNGYFNMVVNDHERSETHFCNDSFGGLPLYIAQQPDRIVFASTYEGLRQQGLTDQKLDPVGTAELYWAGYQLGNRTALRNVRLLPSGNLWTVRWRDGQLQVRELPKPAESQPTLRTIDEAAEYSVASMRQAAKRLYRTDVGVGIKVSAGMDSRLICGTWPDSNVHTYTYGHRRSAEVRLARELALALGMKHTFVPIEGDFFTQLHASVFPLHGVTEFFHHAALPAMQRDGVTVALDGIAGGGIIGGQWSKHGQSKWRQALGLAEPEQEQTTLSDEAIAQYVFDQIRLSDAHYRPVLPDVHRDLKALWPDILHDIVQEVRQSRASFKTFDDIYTDVTFRNRTRRYISLQGVFYRPYVESLYPFLDRDVMALRGAVRPEWLANKRLYVEIYTRHMPSIRSVPGIFSLLPFTIPRSLHFPGRAVRYGVEQVGLKISYGTRDRVHPWASNAVQWARWLAFNGAFRDGARAFMRNSKVYDDAAFQRDTRNVAAGPKFSATRFLATAAYCGHYRS
jgi:asparagine synthetase B (glutamine-hydrolysing)